MFSALIHDLDHRGVPNGQLAKEQPELASTYKNTAIAEQNSVDLGWEIFMGDQFKALRRCLYADEADFKRLRQIVVNNVMATDIFDKELSAIRTTRWNKAFAQNPRKDECSPVDEVNRKATIVIEQ